MPEEIQDISLDKTSLKALIKNMVKKEQSEQKGSMIGAGIGMMAGLLASGLSTYLYLGREAEKVSPKEDSSWAPTLEIAIYCVASSALALYLGYKLGQKVGDEKAPSVDAAQLTTKDIAEIKVKEVREVTIETLKELNFNVEDKKIQAKITDIVHKALEKVDEKINESSKFELSVNP